MRNVKRKPIVIKRRLLVASGACSAAVRSFDRAFKGKWNVPLTVGNLRKLYGTYLKMKVAGLNKREAQDSNRYVFINDLTTRGRRLVTAIITNDSVGNNYHELKDDTLKMRVRIGNALDKLLFTRAGNLRDTTPKLCREFIKLFVALAHQERDEYMARVIPALLAQGLNALRQHAIMPALVNRAFVPTSKPLRAGSRMPS